ncbi:DUF2914 domain-containing protein [Formosa algae]|uniref:DUF2914 domain-containing protein n=1 Tax=Formosa algae TaxID=225843 RepID=UPI002936F63E|nr:DUF2914 domain-containing protein [Formosa algae]
MCFLLIFAPTALQKSIIHRWKWYNESINEWVTVDNISYNITGGRNNGYRGYTYKNNIKPGLWSVEVLTEEELLLGVIDFEIITDSNLTPQRLTQHKF